MKALVQNQELNDLQEKYEALFNENREQIKQLKDRIKPPVEIRLDRLGEITLRIYK